MRWNMEASERAYRCSEIGVGCSHERPVQMRSDEFFIDMPGLLNERPIDILQNMNDAAVRLNQQVLSNSDDELLEDLELFYVEF